MPDPGRAAGFLSWVAESARFIGADPAAARDWVLKTDMTDSDQLELAGVTYTLSGSPDASRLQMVATE